MDGHEQQIMNIDDFKIKKLCHSMKYQWNWNSTRRNKQFEILRHKIYLWFFLDSPPYVSVFITLQVTCAQGAWERGRVRQFEFFNLIFAGCFFHSWYTPKEHVFSHPNTFLNLQKAIWLISQHILIQRWTTLIQRKPALNSSETVLVSADFLNPFWNSAGQRWNLWNLWNSADQRWNLWNLWNSADQRWNLWNLWNSVVLLWDFNPGWAENMSVVAGRLVYHCSPSLSTQFSD